MNRFRLTVAILLLCLPALNPVQATHQVPDQPDPQFPHVPEEPVVHTGVIPLDGAQEDAAVVANATRNEAQARADEALDEGDGLLSANRGPGFLDLFGDGSDANRHGGFGEWQDLGDAWRLGGDPDDRHHTSTGDDGRYKGFTAGLLVLPELDLRTGIGKGDPTGLNAQYNGAAALAEGSTDGDDEAPRDLLQISAAYRFVSQHLLYLAEDECSVNGGAVGCLPSVSAFFPGAPPPPDALFRLDFDRRHNLGRARDGVQVLVFTEPPSLRLADACEPAPWQRDGDQAGGDPGALLVDAGQVRDEKCTIVQTLGGYGAPARAFDRGEARVNDERRTAYTGFSGWQRESIDLTPWGDRSVWVGFLFRSSSVSGPSYFANPALFDQEAGFTGFELDNVVASAPAASQSLRVRPFLTPADAETPGGRPHPTIATGAPFEVAFEVVNMGTAPFDADVRLQAATADGNALVGETDLGRVRLGPTEATVLDASFVGLTVDPAEYVVTASAMVVGRVAPDPDPSDDAFSARVDVANVPALRVSSLQRGLPTVALGGQVAYDLALTNEGNVPAVAVLRAAVIHEVTKAPTQAVSFAPSTPADRQLTVAPGVTERVRWTLNGDEPGQYRFFVSLNDPAPFDAIFDLDPPGPPTFPAVWIESHQAPAVDGAVVDAQGNPSDAVWGIADATHHVEFVNPYTSTYQPSNYGTSRGTVRVVADADHLWLGAAINTVPEGSPALRVYVDQGTATPLTLEMVKDAAGLQGEVQVPLAGLPLTDRDELRLLVEWRDARGPRRAPAGATMDGEGFAAPDGGSLQDEMRSWMHVRLPSQPASNVAAARLVGLGFGVERAPPPFLAIALDACTDLDGWQQDGMRNVDGTAAPTLAASKWNCGPYGPDGEIRLYEGRSPETTCGGGPCDPWSLASLNPASPNLDAGASNSLFTPPIRLGDISDPFLVVKHQYSTWVAVNDLDESVPLNMPTSSPDKPVRSGSQMQPGFLYRMNHARVYIQEWNEAAAAWGPQVLLNPPGGYPSEADVGVIGPDDEPHAFPFNSNHDPVKVPGWWAPAGWLAYAAEPGADPPAGRAFTGSPWKVERIPLFGFEHGPSRDQTVSVANKTIRLVFDFLASERNPTDSPEHRADLGWRIEAFAITEGPRFSRDVRATQVSVEAPLYDVRELGIGPGTDYTVNVTVSNEGLLPASGLRVCVRAFDLTLPPPTDPHPCNGTPGLDSEDTRVPGVLSPGEERTFLLPLRAPAQPGGRIQLAAAVVPDAGDDFPRDNVLRSTESFVLRAVADARIVVDALKRSGPLDEAFPFQVLLENRGNVPLSGFTVTRTVTQIDGELAGSAAMTPRSWVANASDPEGILGIGQRLLLGDLALEPALGFADLRLPAPDRSATFAVSTTLALDGDADPSDNAATVFLRSLDILQRLDFSSAASMDALEVGGPAGVWEVTAGSLSAGSNAELPPHADSTVLLNPPGLPFDLRGARSAALTLRHRYELEASDEGGFDAARVEFSTDGQEWRSLVPQPSEISGLPRGYPDLPLLGDSPLATASPGQNAVAFTGSSAALRGAEDGGWIESVFDLGRDPEFSVRTTLRDLPVPTGASQPHPDPAVAAGGGLEFTHPDWTLEEPGAAGRLLYWAVHNASFTSPHPHSGDAMWWSGSAGPATAGQPQEKVRNRLALDVTLPAEHPAVTKDQVLVSWWEWRAGHADGGTGGRFKARLAGHADAPLELAAEPSGWRQYAFDVTDLLGASPTQVQLRWDYTSAVHLNLPDPAVANNRGWFIDDVAVTAYAFDDRLGVRHSPAEMLAEDIEDLAGVACPASAGAWSSSVRAGGPVTPDPIRWCVVGVAAAEAPGGWHVEPARVPGVGDVPAWRFSSSDEQGYPHLADSRLVTPLVDLTQANGKLALRFDHRYWFEEVSGMQCPVGFNKNQAESAKLAAGCFHSAVDGGAIEYQILDPATGTFGPWQQLARGFDDWPAPPRLDAKTALLAGACDGQGDYRPQAGQCVDNNRTADRLSPGNVGAIASSGYGALEDRTPRLTASWDANRKPTGFASHPSGHGTSFEAFPALLQGRFYYNSATTNPMLTPWLQANVSYVLSGQSPGLDGWSGEAWNVTPLAGEQVRFAFHAVTNPSYSHPAPSGTERGWTVANMRVEGDAFVGKPVHLRLRLATDGSLGLGEWQIDSVTLSGPLSVRNAAVIPDGELPAFGARGQTLRLDGRIANLGTSPAAGLILGLSVVDEQAQAPYPASKVDLVVPGAQVLAGSAGYLPGGEPLLALPPLDLEFRPDMAFHLSVDLPADEDARLVARWYLLEPAGSDTYRAARLDVAGNAVSEWRIVGRDSLAASLSSPDPGRAGPLVPAGALTTTGPTAVSTRLSNDGTSTLDELTATWTLDRIERKAGVGQAAQAQRVWAQEQELESLAPGRSLALAATVPASGSGLYAVGLEIREGSAVVAQDSFEALVGLSPTYHAAEFASGLQGWGDASPPVAADGGGTPAPLRFRFADGGLLWGVTLAQYSAGTTYCSSSVAECDFAPATNPSGQATAPDPGPPVFGLDGRAHGPFVDLRRVPDSMAFLTLDHEYVLEAQDGARVELIPYREPFDALAPKPLYTCGDGPGDVKGQAMSFILVPDPASGHDALATSLPYQKIAGIPAGGGSEGRPGQTVPDRYNPLAAEALDGTPRAVPAFGGSSVATTRFRLDQAAVSSCLDSSGQPVELVLDRYVVRPVLHVGTLPGHTAIAGPEVRHGGQGWNVKAIRVSSFSFGLEPLQPTYPVQPGAPKAFPLLLTNDGAAVDQYTVEVDLDATTLPDLAWVDLPDAPIQVFPGQTAHVPIRIDIPGGAAAPPGSYLLPILVRSVADPGLARVAQATVAVRDLPLPDLGLAIAIDHDRPVFSTGTVEVVHATITNVGRTSSRSADVVMVVVDAAGVEREVDRAATGKLCPASKPACTDGPSRTTVNLEWSVPDEPGSFTVVVRVDPDADLVETSRTNNERALAVSVQPFERPDLAIVSLQLPEASEAGVAEEGELLTIRAEVRNIGTASASDVRFALRFGASELKSIRVPTLEPGQGAVLETVKVLNRGQFVVSATVRAAEVDADPDNDEFRRTLHVQGHEVSLQAPAGPWTVQPGAAVEVPIRIANAANGVDLVALSTATPGWSVLATPNPAVVKPGGSETVSVRITAAPGLHAGTHIVRLQATPAASQAAASILDLEVVVADRVVPPDATYVGGPVAPGPATLAFNVTNPSNAMRTLRVEVTTPGWSSNAPSVAVAAGATSAVAVSVFIPYDAAPGNHTLAAHLRDMGSGLTAQVAFVVALEPSPRMLATWLAPASRGDVGLGAQSVAFPLRIENAGNIPVVPSVRLAGLGPSLAFDAAPLEEMWPGDAVTTVLLVTRPANATDDWTATAEVWMRSAAGFSNALRLALPDPAAAPDLQVSAMDVPQSVVAGKRVAISVTVANAGPVEAPPSRLYAAADGVVIDAADVPRLAPGESAPVNLTWMFDETGRFTLSFHVDGGNAVDEVVGEDNGWTTVVDVQEGDALWRIRQAPGPGAADSVFLLALLSLALGRRRNL